MPVLGNMNLRKAVKTLNTERVTMTYVRMNSISVTLVFPHNTKNYNFFQSCMDAVTSVCVSVHFKTLTGDAWQRSELGNFFLSKRKKNLKKKALCDIYENISLCKNKKFYIWLVLLETYDWKMRCNSWEHIITKASSWKLVNAMLKPKVQC